mmetsp:Transcript_1742/g.3049  ORF Transcript_1742/g.3049 Transcript_1742/m.3049 type:complete len:141 (-) Transcript_1742:7-429(-)
MSILSATPPPMSQRAEATADETDTASDVGSIDEEKHVDLDREAKRRAKAKLDEESEVGSSESGDGGDEVEQRRKQAGRTDVLGIDGVGLFCLIWVVTTGVLFSILYFSIFARDRNFFKPLSQRSTLGKFVHGGIAAVLEL